MQFMVPAGSLSHNRGDVGPMGSGLIVGYSFIQALAGKNGWPDMQGMALPNIGSLLSPRSR